MGEEQIKRLIAEAQPLVIDWSRRSKELLQQKRKKKADAQPPPAKRSKSMSNINGSDSKSRSISRSSDGGGHNGLHNFQDFVSNASFEDSVRLIASRLSPNTFKRHSEVHVINNLLPESVALGLSNYIDELKEDQWITSCSETDAAMYKDVGKGAGSTQHTFSASEGIIVNSRTAQQSVYSETSKSTLMDKFMCILATALSRSKNEEEVLFTLQCGRYTSGHFIEPHDDQAQEVIDGIKYQRDVAIVYYLSKNWTANNGGLFVDLESKPPRSRIPIFNSLITFKVPRLHQVSPIEMDCIDKRYSIFGWALKMENNESFLERKKQKRKKLQKKKKMSRTRT